MRTTKPKLIYLAYFFRPSPAIACVRTWNTAKYLASLGWDVTVVTPHPSLWNNPDSSGATEVDIKQLGIHRIFTEHGWPMLVPEHIRWIPGRIGWFLGGICRRITRRISRAEPQIGWVKSVQRACAGIAPGEFDLILATIGPNVSSRLASWLGIRLKCPFVLDYRDAWTGNPHVQAMEFGAPDEEESVLIQECAAVTVVSDSLARLIAGTFCVPNKVHVVSNGFSPEMFADIQPYRFDHFAVVYAGVLYPPKRVLDPVLNAFAALVSENPNTQARFHFYGPQGQTVQNAARHLGIERYLVVHGQVSRKEALAAQKGAGLVVVISSVEETGTLGENGVITAKIFDCMAMQCPVLVVAPKGSDLYSIAENVGGMRCFTGSDVRGIVSYIMDVSVNNIPQYKNRSLYQWDTIGCDLDVVLKSVLVQKDF